MTGFSVEKIAVDERLRAADGILRAEALTAISDARALGEHIVQEARGQAEEILAQARIHAAEMEQAAEAKVLARAEELLAGLAEANATVADRVAGTVVDLAIGLFDKLVLQTSPRKRIEASLKRLQKEAPSKLMDAVLHVHPADAALLPELEWEIEHDDSVNRGSCRLQAASGEWHACFDAAVTSLRNAFCNAVEQSMEAQDYEEMNDEVDGEMDEEDDNMY